MFFFLLLVKLIHPCKDQGLFKAVHHVTDSLIQVKVVHFVDMFARLEQLPNELFAILFNYFDLPQLHFSFWNLNRRFNDLLQSQRNLSHILKNEQSALLELFAPQISRLKITTSEAVDLSRLCNLRSLHIPRATAWHIEHIRPDLLPHLTDLSLSTSIYISLPWELLSDIFSSGFRSLRDVRLGRIDLLPSSFQCQSVSLRRVHLTCIDPNLVHQILFFCPNLHYFHGTFIGQDHHTVSPPPAYDHPLREFTLHDSYQKLSFETIETLLLYIPSVVYLSLQFACKVPFIRLVKAMVDRLKDLDHFECDILEAPNNQMVSVESLQEMKPCFQLLECFEKDYGYRVFFSE